MASTFYTPEKTYNSPLCSGKSVLVNFPDYWSLNKESYMISMVLRHYDLDGITYTSQIKVTQCGVGIMGWHTQKLNKVPSSWHNVSLKMAAMKHWGTTTFSPLNYVQCNSILKPKEHSRPYLTKHVFEKFVGFASVKHRGHGMASWGSILNKY